MLQRTTGTGELLLADGVSLANACCCEEEPPAPCACDWCPTVEFPFPCPSPKIQDLSGFPNCPSCTQATVEPDWDGVIPLIGACDGATPTNAYNLNGNLFDAGFGIYLTPPCGWNIRIQCPSGFWLYEKFTGLNPFGTYTLSGTSTLCAGAPLTIDVQPA